MLFCDTATAARIERAERDLVAAAARRVAARVAAPLLAEVAGGFAAFTEPGSPLNKVVGLGFAPFAPETWRPLEAQLLQHGPVQVEVSTLADPAVAAWFTAHGYQLVGIENVLGLALAAGPGPALPPDVAIGIVDATGFDAWIDLLATGFATPDSQGTAAHEAFDREVLTRILRDFASTDGMVPFLARRGGVAAGTGTMVLREGVALLCGASTLPAHRRRGVQSALLSYRLAHAAASGCDLAVMTTQPGSKSMQNGLRHGFALLYARCVLRREMHGDGSV